MNAKRRSRMRPLEPSDSLPFDPVEFALSFVWANEMAVDKSPSNSPTNFGLTLETEDGKFQTLRITDTPFNRLGRAIHQRYGHEPDRYYSFFCRVFAVMDLLRSGKLDERFFRRDVDNCDIADEVIYLAATFPVNVNMTFDQRAFLRPLEARTS